MSWKVVFCSGSSTSSRALDGSPWFETVTLSTSSRMMTGLDDPQRLMVWMIRPGIAPM